MYTIKVIRPAPGQLTVIDVCWYTRYIDATAHRLAAGIIKSGKVPAVQRGLRFSNPATVIILEESNAYEEVSL